MFEIFSQPLLFSGKLICFRTDTKLRRVPNGADRQRPRADRLFKI